ncbi:NADH-dependent flavin oxidoreductase [Shimazuella alba]|uniref:NADH-dependent flavin oxidoreductase n=1 Tax=Shimazuella alba TaxID=2690964 RepID=A0A6I4W0W3_9BACL|nr:NADH-dependent flavin oxidoreductase [Shimazuella alba]MXQ55880.1 NADH-dependent flavin oxidoreductase [Shimazuella alba]
MKNQFKKLFEPVTLNKHVTLKNRIMMAPMTHMGSNDDGSISEQEIKYYARRANGVGAIITAGTYVMKNGGLPKGPAVDQDEMIPGLQKLASAIQRKGAKAILQIFHGGRQSSAMESGEVVSASNVPEERQGAPVPRELTQTEITEIISAFGQAARRAIEAGFDGVEIHGANGGLIQQFFSPHANKRTDNWGGTIENRMKFGLAILDGVNQVVKKHAKSPFLVGYRISPEEVTTPGITMADTLSFIDVLATKQLDYLHISLNHFWTPPRKGVNDSRSRLAIIQERIGDKIPIIGVGGIYTPEDALRALETGVPLLAIGRELLLDPDWVTKVKMGKEEEIKTTLSPFDQEKLLIPDGQWNLITNFGWVKMDKGASQIL